MALVSLGCRVNRVESDVIARDLVAAGAHVVGAGDACDVGVVNTCAVTGEAEAKTRTAVRRLLARDVPVIATGCAANLFADELKALGDVSVMADKSLVAAAALELAGVGGAPSCEAGAGWFATPTGRSRAGVKIQDGCDHRCTYCIVWKARGAARSLPVADVVTAVREQVEAGAPEVALTGIDLGSYSAPLAGVGEVGLPALIDHILNEVPGAHLRLASVEPIGIDGGLGRVIAASDGAVAPFIHLPLQAGCDATLRRMARPYTTDEYAERVAALRAHVPGMAIGCDVIVGFPGETDDDFERSLAFCERMRFAQMHVFRYSKRPGTPAATAPDQVPPQVMASRAARMRELAGRMRAEFARGLVGREVDVVCLGSGRGVCGEGLDVRVPESLEPAVRTRLRVRDADGPVLIA